MNDTIKLPLIAGLVSVICAGIAASESNRFSLAEGEQRGGTAASWLGTVVPEPGWVVRSKLRIGFSTHEGVCIHSLRRMPASAANHLGRD